jgi:2-iminobutanoate/2-iminopropanoate deaminase
MKKEVVSTDQSPKAIGPYSQALKVGDFVFVSGQLPLDAASGEIVQGDMKDQTRAALSNLGAVLKAGGSALGNVVKTTVFIRDMAKFPEMNEVYAEFFRDRPPARSCVEVSRLPKNANVEIEAIAFC